MKKLTKIDESRKRGEELAVIEPRATSVWLNYSTNRLEVELTSGVGIKFPIDEVEWLKKLSLDELLIADFEVTPSGYGIHSDVHDIDLAVPPLVLSILHPDFIVANAARINGQVRSVAKAKASKTNGKLGGRPIIR